MSSLFITNEKTHETIIRVCGLRVCFAAVSLCVCRGRLSELDSRVDHWFLELTLIYSRSQKLLRNRNVILFASSVTQASPCRAPGFFSRETWTTTKQKATATIILALNTIY